MIEPRRLAARLSAERIAEERGERCGDLVGYQMRFSQKVSGKTRIRFITEGLFGRLYYQDPSLSHIGVVVIDEFHERHIQTDVALAICRQLIETTRPDLKLVVMSATLDTKALESYLSAPVFDIPGRTFPVHIEHWDEPERVKTEAFLAQAIWKILKDQRCPGNILVFMVGLGEINRAMTFLKQQGFPNVEFLPLSAEVSSQDQERVFSSSAKRKVILATNVAETSLTLPGITGVIDLGRAKIASLAPWSGLTSLDVKRIPQSSCIQRSGRAGRTQEGVCYRLYSEADFRTRAPFLLPEISRLDLASVFLDLLVVKHQDGQGGGDPFDDLKFMDPPPETLKSSALKTLEVTRAFVDGTLTEVGIEISKWPIHPRLASVIVAGMAVAPREALVAAVLIGEGGIVKSRHAVDVGPCDVRYQMRLMELDKARDLEPSQEGVLDRKRLSRVRSLVEILGKRFKINRPLDTTIEKVGDVDFSRMLLSGFSDRVGVLRPQKGKKRGPVKQGYNLCLGRGGVLAEQSVLKKADFIVVLDATESQDKRSKAVGTEIRLASRVKDLVLLDFDSPVKKEETILTWDKKAATVKKEKTVNYGQVMVGSVLDDISEEDRDEARAVFLKELASAWPNVFDDAETLERYHTKLDLMDQVGMHHDFPRFEGEMLELFLETLADECLSFSELATRGLQARILEQLSYDQGQVLKRLFPDSLRLPGGRLLKIKYEPGKPPWAASRLQDFWGMTETPTLAEGRLPLVIHLLAPNQRAVQVTQDLASFWKNSYPKVRQQLSRRYPRHPWPE